MKQEKLKTLYSLLKEYQQENSMLEITNILNDIARSMVEMQLTDKNQNETQDVFAIDFKEMASKVYQYTTISRYKKAEEVVQMLVCELVNLTLSQADLIASLFIRKDRKKILINALNDGEINGIVPDRFEKKITTWYANEKREIIQSRVKNPYSFNMKSLLRWLTLHYTCMVPYLPLLEIIKQKVE